MEAHECESEPAGGFNLPRPAGDPQTHTHTYTSPHANTHTDVTDADDTQQLKCVRSQVMMW